MSLADYPTLDVATLRAVACELRSSLLDQVSAAADAARATARSSIGPRLDDASLDALAQLQDFAHEVSEAITAIGRDATRREESASDARVPLPSDWLRACEGTNCGPYAWDTATEDDGHPNRLHMIRLSWAVRGSGVLVHIVQDGIVHLGIDKWNCDDWDWREIATPAELRAALDRLAAELRP